MNWLIFALGAAFLSSLAAIINKEVLFKEHSTEFSATFAFIIVLISLPMIPWVEFNLSIKVWSLIFSTAFFAAVGFLMIIKALKYMDISIASPLRNFGPAILLIVAFFSLGEKIAPLQILGILILVLGAYVLEINLKKHDLLEPLKYIWKSKYIHFVFISMMSYAISSVFGKYTLNFIKPFTLVFFEQIFIAVLLLSFLAAKFDGLHGVKHGIKKFGWMIVMAAVFTISYRLLQTEAMAITSVSLVIPIKRLDTLFSTLIGGKILKEHGLKIRFLACIVMILGATLIALG